MIMIVLPELNPIFSIFAPSDLAGKRLAICKTCEHYNSMLRNCGKCGCFLDVKTMMSGSTCPLMKW